MARAPPDKGINPDIPALNLTMSELTETSEDLLWKYCWRRNSTARSLSQPPGDQGAGRCPSRTGGRGGLWVGS